MDRRTPMLTAGTLPPMPDRHLIDVHLLLVDGDRVLLSKRRDPDPAFDGRWHLPAGKLDAGESVLDAVVREADEEIGVRLDPGGLRLVHTLHITAPSREPRLGLFFETRRWRGEPVNREPEKSSELGWFPLNDLPDGLIEYPAAGIHGYREGRTFGTLGWA